MRQRHSYSSSRRDIPLLHRPRCNEQIRVPEVLLVNDDGVTEKMPTANALAKAKEQELDLIEIAATAVPPVVKIGNYGSYLYQIKKKEKRQRAHSKQTEVKMIRFGFRTDVGDLDRLAEHAREFLAERHMVKVSIILRGRENANQGYAIEKLNKFLASLAEDAEVEQTVKRQGNQYMAILKPKK